MKPMASFGFFAGLLGATMASAASAPVSPTSKWTIDYTDNMCVLQRSYGTPERPLVLGFKPTPMADGLRLVIILTRDGARRSGRASALFGDAAPAKGVFSVADVPGKPLRAIFIDLKLSELGAWKEATSLTIDAGSAFDETFALNNMAMARQGLDDCMTDLMKSWGMDEAVLASIVTPPVPVVNLASYVSPGDYPDEAIRRNEQGTSGVRFMVGTDGRARDCTAAEPSGSKALDDVTCRVITERARFTPAKDRDGKAVPSLSYTRITWSMPAF